MLYQEISSKVVLICFSDPGLLYLMAESQAKLDMARTVEIERNMTNSEAQYFATGDSLWRLIEYYTSVDIFSNVAGYLKNINTIFHHILVQFAWYDKIDCIRVNCAIIY